MKKTKKFDQPLDFKIKRSAENKKRKTSDPNPPKKNKPEKKKTAQPVIRRILFFFQTVIVLVKNLHFDLDHPLNFLISQILDVLVTRRELRVLHNICPGPHSKAGAGPVRDEIQLVKLARNGLFRVDGPGFVAFALGVLAVGVVAGADLALSLLDQSGRGGFGFCVVFKEIFLGWLVGFFGGEIFFFG